MLFTVERSHFDQPVTLTVEGVPPGLTAAMNPATLQSGASSSTLQISASGSATPGPATLTVRAKGDGVPDQTVAISLGVNVTGNFSLAMNEASVTVAQGGGGLATVLVPRTGGNAGAVTISMSGAPAGLTGNFSTLTTTKSAATLTLAATASVATGTYTITITGTSPGLSDQITTLPIVVIAPPGTATISVPLCSTVPVWFAYQNEGYNWQVLTPTGSTFTFAATQKVSVAFVLIRAGVSQVNIASVLRAELAATSDRDCPGPKTLSGTVAGLSTTQAARVVMGAVAVRATADTPSFTLRNVASRSLDLVATRGAKVAFLTPDKLIIRRGVNLASGAAISPALDFGASEAFAPASNTLTVTGLTTGDSVELQNSLWTTTSSYGLVQTAAISGGTTTLFSTPAAQLQSGDLHELSVDAWQVSTSLLTGHQYVIYFGAPASRTDAMGPNLAAPALSIITNTPFSRMRGRLPLQPEYNTAVQFGYWQTPSATVRRIVLVTASAGYLGGAPSTWDTQIPDFSSFPGFDTGWMLAPNQSTNYFAQAFSGRTDLLFGALPAQGDLVRIGYRVGQTSTTQLLRAQWGGAATQTLHHPHQYFRR